MHNSPTKGRRARPFAVRAGRPGDKGLYFQACCDGVPKWGHRSDAQPMTLQRARAMASRYGGHVVSRPVVVIQADATLFEHGL